MSRTIVEGARGLTATMTQFKETTRKRIARGGVNRALVILAKHIKRNVPKATTPGRSNRRIRRGIGQRPVKASRDRYGGKAGVNVGYTSMKDEEGQRIKIARNRIAPHAIFIALGTKKRRTTSGAYRGRVRQNRFVKAGARAGKSEALREMKKRINKTAAKEWVKLKRKNRSKG